MSNDKRLRIYVRLVAPFYGGLVGGVGFCAVELAFAQRIRRIHSKGDGGISRSESEYLFTKD